jgi:hypothetical protein
VSETSVTLSWTAPVSDGGCPISAYAIYVDDGAGGALAEYGGTAVRLTGPLLSSWVVDMATAGKAAGASYLFQLGAVNSIGEATSDTVAVLLAGVPSQPTPATRAALNSTHVKIVMAAPASAGGSPVTSYEL